MAALLAAIRWRVPSHAQQSAFIEERLVKRSAEPGKYFLKQLPSHPQFRRERGPRPRLVDRY
jgi:hypothetical protein